MGLVYVHFCVIASVFGSPQYLSSTEAAHSIPSASVEVYEETWSRWLNRKTAGSPSTYEYFVSNEEFRRVLDIGPECIPWLLSKDGVGQRCAKAILSRVFIPNVRGLSLEEGRYLRTELDESWWADPVISSASFFPRNRASFDSLLAGLAQQPNATQVREYKEWRQLEDLGILGIPFVVDRIRTNRADKYDYLLITWWTSPIQFTLDGWPFLSYRPEHVGALARVALPSANEDRAYWLNWWEKNKAEYWWLLSKEELASLKSMELPTPRAVQSSDSSETK